MDISLDKISGICTVVDETAQVIVGDALRLLCPDSEQCDNEGSCEFYSCRFAEFIFYPILTVIQGDLKRELGSFLKNYLTRLHEQTPYLVDFQIRNTEKNSQADEKY